MNTFFAVAAERSRPYRIVGVAAVLMAAVAIGVMFATSANRPQPTGSVPAGAVSSPSVGSTSPSPGSVPAAELLAIPAAFTCSSSSIASKPAPSTSFVDALRTGTHVGYDRIVVEFKNGQPGSITLRPQAGTTFNQSPSGQPVRVAGRHGLLVIIRGADAHTAYSGSRDLRTGYAALVETRVLEDFEGQVSLGLGLNVASCYRAAVLANPVRLVIDLQTR
jgi:hypothetical protein